MNHSTQAFEMIAKTFKGLEEILAQELIELGANNVQIQRRAVSFTGDKSMMYKANLHLRTASRILKPIAEFKAKNPDEIYDAIKKINWEEIMDIKTTFAVDSTVYSDDFRHSQFISYKVKDAIVDFFREKYQQRPSVRLDNPALNINLHIAQNHCTLSLDSSGESLHKRGYRISQNEAPLNEALAAGLILLTGWKGECDFIDPMCGSGTLLIEAALIALNIPPGIFKNQFAFEKWKDFDRDLFQTIYEDDSLEKEFEHKIYGYDIAAKAIAISDTNVKSAGLSKYISLQKRPIADFEAPHKKSIIVTNPPYGERITTNDLLGLYAQMGSMLKHKFSGNTAWIISSNIPCLYEIALKPTTKIELLNGGLESLYCQYEIFEGKRNEHLNRKKRR